MRRAAANMMQMIGSVVVAVIGSMLSSYLDVMASNARYWRRWGGGVYFGAAAALFTVWGLVGLGGWFLDDHFIRQAKGEWLTNGLVAVAIGQVLFRLDAQLFEIEGRGPALSLLVGTKRHLLRRIKNATDDAVFEKVRALNDAQLEQLAFDILERFIASDENIPAPTKVDLADQLVDASDELRTDNPARGRSRLVNFATRTIIDRRLTFKF